jgi:hypothetical protein
VDLIITKDGSPGIYGNLKDDPIGRLVSKATAVLHSMF